MKKIAKCASNLQLSEVLALLSCADIFVGNDSGITHLAATLGLKTIAVFGPTNPEVYRPIGPEVTVFEDKNNFFADKPSPDLQYKLLDTLVNMNPI